jgi:antitoxin MazE
MYMVTKVLKWGNSLGVRIPKAFAKDAGMAAGSEVDFQVRDGQLVIRPLAAGRYSLAQLIEEITPSNLHEEIGTGGGVGRETW